MESRDENSQAILYVISKLRVITRVVQLAPFVYAFLYILISVLYLFPINRTALGICDMLFIISPFCIVLFLIESRILKLCKWHKTACCIPLVSQVPIFIDDYIAEFSISAVSIAVSTIIVMTVLFVISAYKVFFTDNGRRK